VPAKSPYKNCAVWISDDGARAFLGLTETVESVSRWAVLCDLQEESPIGIWVRVHEIQQWTPSGTHKWKAIRSWHVTPPDCVLRWDFIITMQRNVNFEELEPPGFKPTETPP
jgi:hypothetical protein